MPRRIMIDLTPLRENADFRMLFAGQLAEVFGSQINTVAIAFQVYELTGSSFQVGAVSLVQLVPLIFGALVGGALGDHKDRRLMLVMASSVLGMASGTLAIIALFHGLAPLIGIYLLSAIVAGVGGVLSTTNTATVPVLVRPGHLVPALAATQVADQLSTVIGPAATGLLIGFAGLPWVYAIVAGLYAASAVMVSRMRPLPAGRPGGQPGVRSIIDGLRFLRGRQVLQGAYLLDINAMVFGMPRALFPALAVSVFHGGAAALGYLYAAPGAGALIGALTTGWLDRVRRQALAVCVAVGVWGAAIVAFGLERVLWPALILLAVAGWADVISAVLRNTILQSSVPEAMRARISAMQIAVVEGGPKLGDLEAGTVAAAVSPGFSVVSGGLACIAGAALLTIALPGFRRYRPEADEPPRACPSPRVT